MCVQMGRADRGFSERVGVGRGPATPPGRSLLSQPVIPYRDAGVQPRNPDLLLRVFKPVVTTPAQILADHTF